MNPAPVTKDKEVIYIYIEREREPRLGLSVRQRAGEEGGSRPE